MMTNHQPGCNLPTVTLIKHAMSPEFPSCSRRTIFAISVLIYTAKPYPTSRIRFWNIIII